MHFGVNGVGPQAGLALIQECTAIELIAAICSGDLRRLCKAQGVGKRTAERLAVELRTTLAALNDRDPEPSLVEGGASSDSTPESGDLEETLTALGYEDLEIRRAMRAVREGPDPPANDDTDAWIRSCLRWLSRDSA